MLTPNCGCAGATYKFTCNDTVFASLVMACFNNHLLTIVQLLLIFSSYKFYIRL